MLAAMLAILLNLLADMPQNRALAYYNCGTSGGNHCYGTNTWSGSTSGARTFVKVRSIQGGEIFLLHALWLKDITYPWSWVEGGYIEIAGDQLAMKYYWADDRPDYPHRQIWLSQVPTADIGSNVSVQFWKNVGSFSVVLNSPNFYYSAYSTPNTMNANEISIGIELAGTSNASSPWAQYSNNYWRDFSPQWRAQTNNGSYSTINWPVYANWNTLPTQSSTGGVWQAYCGC